MMATVFFMQPLGQISGNLISLIVVILSRAEDTKDLTRSVDIMWRWVIGIGIVPGIVASIFRFVIPETPRFLLDIEDDPIKAEFDATQLFGGSAMDAELEDHSRSGSLQDSSASQANQPLDEVASPTTTTTSGYRVDWALPGAPMTTLNSKWTLSKADILQYFWKEGNWRTLLATSLCWLLLDFGFYGIGLSTPQSLARIWGHGSLKINGPRQIWKTNDDPNASVYTMFMNTSVQALVILNVGSVTGGLLLIFFVDRLNRVNLQKYSFLFVAALFIALGTMMLTGKENGGVTIALHVISQFAFNFGRCFTPPSQLIVSASFSGPGSNSPVGPNATTYIITGELFPTRYRASCHGISAAMGKLGSILAQIFSAYYKLDGSGPGEERGKNYGTVLLVFSAAMILGAVVTHFWIPDVQHKDKKNKTLETLAAGRLGRNSQSMAR
jgi:PHS family inorganic phosphate transporter-like MFS transporter